MTEHSWRNWPPSPPPYPPHSNEVEHRLTSLEVVRDMQEKLNARFKVRLKRIEYALMVISGVTVTLVSGKAHDYVPTAVDILIQLLGTMR